MRKTVLVTGGAGFIGSITVKELTEVGYQVVVLDSLENGHREAVDSRAVLEIADLKDSKTVDQIFKKYQIDAVIDFAAYIAVGESMEEPRKYLDNNVFNFINLIETMLRNNCNLLIKSSTASVYGNPTDKDDLPLVEDYTEKKKFDESQLLSGAWEGKPVAGEEFFKEILDYYRNNTKQNPKLSAEEVERLRIPTSVYGLTKMLDEIVMKKYDELSGLKYIALRYFNVAGATLSGEMGQVVEKPTHIFANSIFNLLGKNEKLTIFGNDYDTSDGTGIRDYIHVLDIASGHIAALQYLLNSQKSDTINLGTGRGYSVLQVIKAVEKAGGKKVKFCFGPKRSGDVSEVFANVEKASKLLGWRAKYSLRDMAETAWKWHSEHPEGYRSIELKV